MLLSKEISKGDFLQYTIENEKQISALGLLESSITESICTFIENEKYLESLKNNIKMVITTKELKDKVLSLDKGVIVVNEPRKFFFDLHNYLVKNEKMTRFKVENTLGKNCQISKLAFISETNVKIGDNVIIEPFTMIYDNVEIGDNCVIRSGSTIGGCGFEFKRGREKILSVSHAGGVVIGKDVEIQNNSCIDRAVYFWDDTVIGDYTKIDNLIYIAHAAKIGKRVLIAASSNISGRVEIGDDSWIGVGSTVSNGIAIGKKARVNIGAVVTKDVNDEESVTGNFAIPHARFLCNLKKLTK